MRKRVLVTRPEPGASETASRLAELGHVPIKLALQETRALAVPGGTASGNFAAVAVTSANAVRHAPRALLKHLSSLPCFAVGEATAAAARASGFAHVTEAGGDAGTLAGTIAAAQPAGTLIYLCGRIRRPLFEQRLANAGVRVEAVETYCTTRRVPSSDEVIAATGASAVDVVLIYSANAAEAMVATAGKPGLRPLFEPASYLCLSPRIAEALTGKVSGRVMAAAQPSEAALLALIHHVGRAAS